jgi:hypothetical protein
VLPCPKVMIHAVEFSRARRATIEQHHPLKPLAQLWMELDECLVERTLPYTGRSRKNDETSLHIGAHSLPPGGRVSVDRILPIAVGYLYTIVFSVFCSTVHGHSRVDVNRRSGFVKGFGARQQRRTSLAETPTSRYARSVTPPRHFSTGPE